jgi:hypothetical protein
VFSSMKRRWGSFLQSRKRWMQKTGAGVEGLRLQRQTGAHGSLRKGTEGRAVGQCVTTPQRTYPKFHLT